MRANQCRCSILVARGGRLAGDITEQLCLAAAVFILVDQTMMMPVAKLLEPLLDVLHREHHYTTSTAFTAVRYYGCGVCEYCRARCHQLPTRWKRKWRSRKHTARGIRTVFLVQFWPNAERNIPSSLLNLCLRFPRLLVNEVVMDVVEACFSGFRDQYPGGFQRFALSAWPTVAARDTSLAAAAPALGTDPLPQNVVSLQK